MLVAIIVIILAYNIAIARSSVLWRCGYMYSLVRRRSFEGLWCNVVIFIMYKHGIRVHYSAWVSKWSRLSVRVGLPSSCRISSMCLVCLGVHRKCGGFFLSLLFKNRLVSLSLFAFFLLSVLALATLLSPRISGSVRQRLTLVRTRLGVAPVSVAGRLYAGWARTARESGWVWGWCRCW